MFRAPGVIVLDYQGGETCHTTETRNTLIQFVCSPNSGDGEPVYIGETDTCTYQIYWPTAVVCEGEVSVADARTKNCACNLVYV